jgi:UDP-2,3-diacylglucosamine pyrophosphatase LpxH
MTKTLDRFLFISDLQIPFEAPRALQFCQAVARDFKIPMNAIYNVGDEVDQYFGGQWDKYVEADHTPLSEIAETIDKLRSWYQAFPHMKLAVSNHGLRWIKKAAAAQIPSQMIVPYQKIIKAPKTWVWKDRWEIDCKYPILMMHGMGYSGQQGHRNAAVDAGMNTVIGHLHSHAAITYIKTETKRYWGMNCGSLIDDKSYAFHYGKYSRQKPVLGVGVVVDKGLTPIFVPYERF